MNTFLFDLDGTLLPMNHEKFEAEYFKLIASKFIYKYKPEEMIKYIWEATKEMVINTDPNKTNKSVFVTKFCSLTGEEEAKIYNEFLDFYNSEYKLLKGMFEPSVYMKKAIEILRSKGYKLVVATNPLFPLTAIKDRIAWAGFDAEEFDLITCFEDMHYCKPQIKYYEEILSLINRCAEECIMIGNDVEEDLVAGSLGIKTFLINNNVLNKGQIDVKCDYSGCYEDFYSFVLTLPNVE